MKRIISEISIIIEKKYKKNSLIVFFTIFLSSIYYYEDLFITVFIMATINFFGL
jgi:hypothetical protein